MLFWYIYKKGIRWIFSSFFATVLLGFFDSVLFWGLALLQIPLIKNFIENVLHESTDLTGRTLIYARAMMSLTISPIFGVGNENNYTVARMFSKGANLQNGILDNVLSYGLVGTGVFLLLLLFCIYKGKKINNYPFVIWVYVWIVLSMVEVTLRAACVYTCILAAVIPVVKDSISQKGKENGQE